MARKRRWVLRVFLGLLGLLILCVVAALVVLANLEWGPVKSFAQGKARAQGLDIDYDSASVTWGGVHVRGLRVASPAADAKLAPNLLSIGAIDGSWSPLSKRVDDLVIHDVAVTVVRDEDGKTSIDRLLAGMPPSPPSPPTPLSRLLAGALPTGVAVHARLEGVTVTVIPRGRGPRMQLTGIAAVAELGGGKLTLRLGLEPLRLTMGERSAAARLEGSVELDATGHARVGLDLTLDKQDLAPELPPVKRVLQLALAADFVPGEKRTHVRVEKLALMDGELALAADADLYDTADAGLRPVVHSASCHIDIAALARAAPASLGPLAVDAEPIECTARDLEITPALRGQASLKGRIASLAWRDIAVRGLGLDVSARPEGVSAHIPVEKVSLTGTAVSGVDAKLTVAAKDGRFPFAVHGDVTVADLASAGTRAHGTHLTLDSTVRSATSLDARAAVDVDRVEGPARVEGTHLDLDARDVVLGEAPTAKVKLSGRVAQVAQPGTRVQGVVLALEGALGGHEPSRAKLRLDADRLDVAQLPPGPAHLEVDASRVVMQPPGGEATIAASFGGGTLSGTVAGSASAATWDLDVKAERVGPARALAVHTRGSYGKKKIEQDTTVETGRVATAGAALRAAHIHLVSSGTLRRQQATISAALDGLTVGHAAAGSPKLELQASADLDTPKVDLRLKGRSPEMDLRASAALDRGRTLRWETEGKVAGLSALAALLPPGPDWRHVAVEVQGRGTVAGIVRAVRGGVPVLVADPLARARGKQSLRVAVRNVHYSGAQETSADVDALTVKADAELGEPRKVALDVDVPGLAAVASGVHVNVEGLHVHADATQNRRGDGVVHLAVGAKRIGQSAFASYPVRDLDLKVAVTGNPKAALKIHARLDNPGAGTTFEADGDLDRRVAPAVDAVPERNSVVVTGKLTQVLDKLDGAPSELRASGRVTIPFRVESGDLSLFYTSAQVKLEKVAVELPPHKIALSDVNGVLPISEELVFGPEGTSLVGRGELGGYPEHRYLDQQPFLDTVDYLSVGSLRAAGTQLGPLAANVRVDRDVVALDQMEMNAFGGKITGQCLVELRQKDTRITFRGKVTGVRPSSGSNERLDANAALTLMPYRLRLDGRIEIVRIGSDHLRDLLDVMDPYHADVSANRIRKALSVGYPKQVRLHFLHGFASAHIELGGLAKAVRIDDIRGVPIGPALESWLAPVLEATK